MPKLKKRNAIDLVQSWLKTQKSKNRAQSLNKDLNNNSSNIMKMNNTVMNMNIQIPTTAQLKDVKLDQLFTD